LHLRKLLLGRCTPVADVAHHPKAADQILCSAKTDLHIWSAEFAVAFMSPDGSAAHILSAFVEALFNPINNFQIVPAPH
jgi:hypothetical protein